MSNRFEKEEFVIRIPFWAGYALRIVVIAAVLILFIYALHAFGSQTIERQEESLENAITRDIIQCYALEGSYPPSLSYIEEHYGLTYDHSTFFVDYRPIAGNLYPDVTILKIRSSGP